MQVLPRAAYQWCECGFVSRNPQLQQSVRLRNQQRLLMRRATRSRRARSLRTARNVRALAQTSDPKLILIASEHQAGGRLDEGDLGLAACARGAREASLCQVLVGWHDTEICVLLYMYSY